MHEHQEKGWRESLEKLSEETNMYFGERYMFLFIIDLKINCFISKIK